MEFTIEYEVKTPRKTIPPDNLILEVNGLELTKETLNDLVNNNSESEEKDNKKEKYKEDIKKDNKEMKESSEEEEEEIDMNKLIESFNKNAVNCLKTDKIDSISLNNTKTILQENMKKYNYKERRSIDRSSDSINDKVIKEVKVIKNNEPLNINIEKKTNYSLPLNYQKKLFKSESKFSYKKSNKYSSFEKTASNNNSINKVNIPIKEDIKKENKNFIKYVKSEVLPNNKPNPYYNVININEENNQIELLKKEKKEEEVSLSNKLSNLSIKEEDNKEKKEEDNKEKKEEDNKEKKEEDNKEKKEDNKEKKEEDNKEKKEDNKEKKENNKEKKEEETKQKKEEEKKEDNKEKKEETTSPIKKKTEIFTFSFEDFIKSKKVLNEGTSSSQKRFTQNIITKSREENKVKPIIRSSKYEEVGFKKEESNKFVYHHFQKENNKQFKEYREELKKFIIKHLNMASFAYDLLIENNLINLTEIHKLFNKKNELTEEIMGKIRLLMRKGKLREKPKQIKDYESIIKNVIEVPVKITLSADIFKKSEKKAEETSITKFITQMNRVTWKNINECTEEILKIGPVSNEEMKQFAKVTYKKCVSEKVYLKVYVALMTIFNKKLLTIEESNNEKFGLKSRNLFMREIQRLCKDAIEKNGKFLCDYENMTENEKESAYIESNTIREKILESIDTLGLLYKDGLTPIKAFHNIILNVKDFKIEDDIEIFAYTIKLWGPILITKQRITDLNNAINLIKNINPKCSFKMKFKIEDAIEEIIKFDSKKELKYEIPWKIISTTKSRSVEKIKIEEPNRGRSNKTTQINSLDLVYQKHFGKFFKKIEFNSLIIEIEDMLQEIYDFSDIELKKEILEIKEKRKSEYFNVAAFLAAIQNYQINHKQLARFLKYLFIERKELDVLREICISLKEDHPDYESKLNKLILLIN